MSQRSQVSRIAFRMYSQNVFVFVIVFVFVFGYENLKFEPNSHRFVQFGSNSTDFECWFRVNSGVKKHTKDYCEITLPPWDNSLNKHLRCQAVSTFNLDSEMQTWNVFHPPQKAIQPKIGKRYFGLIWI